ncbi:MAG: DUF4160 domain-containing protein [Pontiellaceae bacterium]|nr:DUF4160 domain-containing protein [Pontiellaceae bacterium]
MDGDCFFSNETGEPPHIHCTKAECDAKYWLNLETYDIHPAYEYNLKPVDRRMIRKNIFLHFDEIMNEWNRVIEESGQ